MSGVNKVIIVGRVGRDPEVRALQSGDKIVTLSVATSETWKDKSGQRQERTEWHRVVIFNPGLATVAERYVKKGALIAVEGALQTRKWTDQSGAERYTTEIVLQKFRGELTLLGDGGQRQEPSRGAATGVSPDAPIDLDDDIPF